LVLAFNNPAVTDFKNQFVRDFPYGTDMTIAVLDSDIASAFQQVNLAMNQALWGDQGSYTLAYLYLAAHYLVLNLRASSQGLNGQWTWLQNNKAAGPVSEGFEIPQRIKDNPDFAAYYKTHYGAQYMNWLWPQLSGQVFAVAGTSWP
jgi:hypothetical protein